MPVDGSGNGYLREMRIPRGNAAGGREFERQMEERRRSDHPERRCGAVGSWAMRNFGVNGWPKRTGRSGITRADPSGGRALNREELKRRGWDRKELKRRRKVQGAGRLRKETTMNWPWIAASLMMGAADYAAACARELLKQS